MSPLAPSAKLSSMPSSKRLATVIMRLAFLTRNGVNHRFPSVESHVQASILPCRVPAARRNSASQPARSPPRRIEPWAVFWLVVVTGPHLRRDSCNSTPN